MVPYHGPVPLLQHRGFRLCPDIHHARGVPLAAPHDIGEIPLEWNQWAQLSAEERPPTDMIWPDGTMNPQTQQNFGDEAENCYHIVKDFCNCRLTGLCTTQKAGLNFDAKDYQLRARINFLVIVIIRTVIGWGAHKNWGSILDLAGKAQDGNNDAANLYTAFMLSLIHI